MNTIEEAFLTVLKSAIHPMVPPIDDECVLINAVDSDWIEILEMANKQNLLPLIYDGLTQIPSFAEFEANHPNYFTSVTACITQQMQKNEEFLALYNNFLSNGLSPIVLKGLVCRKLYGEKADFRPSGDEDILIERKNFEKAQKILNSCGYRSEKKLDKTLDAVHEVTFVGENLVIELHFSAFGRETETRDRMNTWFSNVFDSNEVMIIENVPVRIMPPSDYLLFLVFHAYKHFSFAGFGIRMLADILLFAEKYEEQIDWEYVDKALSDVGISGFYSDLTEIGDSYLGFHLPQRYQTVCPDDLLADMLRMGTFGNNTTADWGAGKIVVDRIQMTDKDENHAKGKMRSYMRLLFPSWKTWISSRPYLNDKPWMVVPEWFKRVGRYLRHESSLGNMKEINESYEIAERRLELLRKYKVI